MELQSSAAKLIAMKTLGISKNVGRRSSGQSSTSIPYLPFDFLKRKKTKIHRRDVIEDKCQLAFPSCPISFLLSALYCPNLPTAFLCTTATFCRASARPQHVVQVRCAIARRRDPLQQTKADRSKLRTPSPYDASYSTCALSTSNISAHCMLRTKRENNKLSLKMDADGDKGTPEPMKVLALR
ncbi:hypothetical protein OUZ56_025062 [Daphnia magna]|uniref:Uncharacterized protein n=1 Tax=Daphnia magna TaxID=35525 RepID=A0ABQ9ZIR2_9CRUS|nr:hypothetical protein OUZ56_025062 [Daphnia magna]